MDEKTPGVKKAVPKAKVLKEVDPDKALQHSEALELLSAIKKGAKGEIIDAQMLGSEGLALKIRGVVSTRIPEVDLVLGRGGYPFGRLTVLTGGEGGGKTTLALHAVAEIQKMGGLAVYADREFKLDPDYAKALGVKLDDLIIMRPRTLEKYIDELHRLITMVRKQRERTGRRRPILHVLDSINALKTKAVLEGDAGDSHVAPEARKWSQHLPDIIAEASREDIALLYISQVRKKIGVMFGSPDDIAGGGAVKFFASAILKVTRVGAERSPIKGSDKTRKSANVLEIIANKNQIAPPFRSCQIVMDFGTGVRRTQSLIMAACDVGLFTMTTDKAFIDQNGQELGRGLKASVKALDADPKKRAALLRLFREKAGW